MSTETAPEDLVFTRMFNAPVAEVWRLWSDPEYVRRWWGPDIFTCPLATIDFREGGTSLVCMSAPQFGDLYSTWQYVTIEPMKRIAYIHNLADSSGNRIDPAAIGMPPDFPQDQHHVVTFQPLDDERTEMTITEYGWAPGQMMEMSKLGMTQCLEKMAAIFAAS
ncbi:MAG TPA: SRPBCC domain-containing protein [Candidatus Kapabacteria bacterium]|nr:SRPBCC domain-containing protein [Candidatus Kapabacteria bacterium]